MLYALIAQESSEDEDEKPRKKKPLGGVPMGPGDIAAGQEFEQPAPAEPIVDPEEEKNKVLMLHITPVQGNVMGLGHRKVPFELHTCHV